MSDWLKEEIALLDAALVAGEITSDDWKGQVAELKRDANAEDDRQAIIDAGRGHLIK